MGFTLLSSPLQGFTDYRFRNAFHKYFGGIDDFYAPYIRLNGKMVIKPIYERDLALKNNLKVPIIPQVMTCDVDEFLFVVDYIQSLGYTELNWNLGCPYPMVINRGMGSGLIRSPEKIDAILDRVHSETDVTVSMKMRLGYDSSEEILDVFPVLEKYPIKNVAIHARIGKQLYKGGVDLEGFQRCIDSTDLPLYFNGDITSLARFEEMTALFPSITHWMIGRGLISNPFLPSMLKEGSAEYPIDRIERFGKFHDTLMHEYQQQLKGEKHVKLKMLSLWDYFATSFSDSTRIVKKIKKAKSLEAYEDAVKDILDSEMNAEHTAHQ